VRRAGAAAFAAGTCAALTAYNNVLAARPWHRRWYVPANVCATGVALAAASASGLTAADLGLRSPRPRPAGPDRAGPQLAGPGLAAAVTVGWAVLAAVPAARPLLHDKRITALDGRTAAYQALVRIPLGTVLWEETAFRGVLQAALARVLPGRAAVAAAAGVFGLWHIRPTLEALRVNGLATTRRQAAAGVAAGVAVTSAGGLLFSWLRSRSGSIAAPMILHLSTNSGAQLAAWAAAGPTRWLPPSPFPTGRSGWPSSPADGTRSLPGTAAREVRRARRRPWRRAPGGNSPPSGPSSPRSH
jgi:membrane protease YdiL (CAAX protease family)